MLLFSDMLYMLLRYASPRGLMSLRCLLLTLSGHVELLLLFFCLLDLCCGEYYSGCLKFVFSYLCVSLCCMVYV